MTRISTGFPILGLPPAAEPIIPIDDAINFFKTMKGQENKQRQLDLQQQGIDSVLARQGFKREGNAITPDFEGRAAQAEFARSQQEQQVRDFVGRFGGALGIQQALPPGAQAGPAPLAPPTPEAVPGPVPITPPEFQRGEEFFETPGVPFPTTPAAPTEAAPEAPTPEALAPAAPTAPAPEAQPPGGLTQEEVIARNLAAQFGIAPPEQLEAQITGARAKTSQARGQILDERVRAGQQETTAALIERLDPELFNRAVKPILDAGGTISPENLDRLFTESVAGGQRKRAQRQQVRSLLRDFNNIAEAMGVDPTAFDFNEESSPDVINAMIKAFVRPKTTPTAKASDFNSFNRSSAKLTETFDKLRSLQLLVNEAREGGFKQTATGQVLTDEEGKPITSLISENVTASEQLKNLFPELFKTITTFDVKDKIFKDVERTLQRLQAEYSSQVTSLEGLSRKDPDLEAAFEELRNQGIVLRRRGQ